MTSRIQVFIQWVHQSREYTFQGFYAVCNQQNSKVYLEACFFSTFYLRDPVSATDY